MRLTPEQAHIIRDTTCEVFGPGVTVSLFGSRTNDELRGGDIDLLVESDRPIEDRFRKRLELGAKLEMRLGEQRIDILVLDPTVPPQPIHEAARRSGVPL